MTQLAHATRGSGSITIPRHAGSPERHSLSILHPAPPPHEDFEAMLATAEARGLSRIAEVLRDTILERDLGVLEKATLAVAGDELLGQALVQFGIARGVLRCRASVDATQEDRLIELLRTIEGLRRVDLVVLERTRPASA